MTNQTLFSPAMATLEACIGATVWLILHTNGLFSSVHLGLPLLSFMGAALGYLYGVLLERQGTPAKQGLLKGGVRLLFPALALVLVVVGLLMKNRATSCWGFFFLILALVPDSIAELGSGSRNPDRGDNIRDWSILEFSPGDLAHLRDSFRPWSRCFTLHSQVPREGQAGIGSR